MRSRWSTSYASSRHQASPTDSTSKGVLGRYYYRWGGANCRTCRKGYFFADAIYVRFTFVLPVSCFGTGVGTSWAFYMPKWESTKPLLECTTRVGINNGVDTTRGFRLLIYVYAFGGLLRYLCGSDFVGTSEYVIDGCLAYVILYSAFFRA